MDNEITTNTGTHYTAEYWMYDARLGRRWNIDPVVKPWLSRYSAFRNNPVIYVDPNGDDDVFTNNETGKTTIIKTNDDFDRNFLDGEQEGGNLEKGWGMKTYGETARIVDLGSDWSREYLSDGERIIGLAAFKTGQDWMDNGETDTETPALDFRFGIVDLGGGFENSSFYQTFFSDFNPKSENTADDFNPAGYYKDGNEQGIYPDERVNFMGKNDTGIPFDLFMYDQPRRVQWEPKNMTWQGNTSFLHKTSSGQINNLITLKWGFIVKDYVVTPNHAQKTDSPSQFHIDNVPTSGDITPKR